MPTHKTFPDAEQDPIRLSNALKNAEQQLDEIDVRNAGALVAALGGLTLMRLLFVAAGPFPLDPEEAEYWKYGEGPAFGYY